MTGDTDWARARAPNLAQAGALAAAAWQRVAAHFPQPLRRVRWAGGGVCRRGCAARIDIEDAYDPVGLYQGVGIARRSSMDVAHASMAVRYPRALLDRWSEGTRTLGHLVTHVLIDEIGHHFGLSDADMARIEAEAAADARRARHMHRRVAISPLPTAGEAVKVAPNLPVA